MNISFFTRENRFVWLMLLLCCVGCECITGHPRHFNMENYQRAVKSGFRKVPEALQIESLFGEADHFISYSGPHVPQDWNTVVYFGGRYTLTMQVQVKTDTAFSEVTKVVGEPRFYLLEASQVIIDPEGHVETKYAGDWKFGLDKWEKVVNAKGDFSAIGISLKKADGIMDFDASVKAQREPRVRVRPD